MFEVAETGRKISGEEYRDAEPQVHEEILELQRELRQSKKSLLILIAGVEGAGKGEVVDRLNRWFDTRDVQTHAFWDETDEERERPRFWRFWRVLPARGTVGVMFGSWYTWPIVQKAFDKIKVHDFDRELQHIEDLERALTHNGTIIIKLWFHLSKELQQKRLSEDKNTKLKKSPVLEEYANSYDAFSKASERAILQTDHGFAPWHIIEASDARYRDICTGRTIIEELRAALHRPEKVQIDELPTEKDIRDAMPGGAAARTVLDNIDLTQTVDGKEYKKTLETLQLKLHDLAWEMHQTRKNAVMVFEGWDAAGKGSALRRVTSAIDARLYRVIPIAAPTDEEKAHHYLWRFWRNIPRAGYITMYDRSWYGRVLVERVEGFASSDDWRRAYQEINDFEGHLNRSGTAVLKFWVHISNEEQLARFEARQEDPRKQHKITDEDWRNRDKWDDYSLAVNDMVAHTSTAYAPWTLVAGNDKKFARLQILQTIVSRLESLVGSKT